MTPDVLIAGAGVAGSSLAILLGRAGLRVELFERGAFPREKPCGEGLMPAGVAALDRLGLAHPVGGASFCGIRYHFGGEVVSGRFPLAGGRPAGGRGVRRRVLDRELFGTAAATGGVTARTHARVDAPLVEKGRVVGLVVGEREVRAPLVVAADGVHSPLRRALGLDRPARRRRVGLCAHFRLAAGHDPPPWVEVFLGAEHELYVTPLPEGELLVAALADARVVGPDAERRFEEWWRAQPELAETLTGAVPLTALRGVTSLGSGARRGFGLGIVLLGDAAGSADPITGGGMSQALLCAELLAGFAARGVDRADLWLPDFERERLALLVDYIRLTRAMLWLAEHRGLAAPVLRALGARPRLFSHLLGVAAGSRSLFRPSGDSATEALARRGPRASAGERRRVTEVSHRHL
jgi:flavin-dependent dehydrogenase